jgi:hypothetical protein
MRRNIPRSNNLTDEISKTRVHLLEVIKDLEQIRYNWVRPLPGGQVKSPLTMMKVTFSPVGF